MKSRLVLLVICSCAVVAFAQEKNPVTSTVKQLMARQQKNLTDAAEEMPADDYSYKPTPAQMSFGHLVMHIAGSNNFLCAKLSGTPAPKSEVKESDGKDKLVSALKESFDFCTTALGKVDDSKLGEPVELFGGRKGPLAMALIGLTNDWADHYAAAAMYLRLKGMLPPTAKKKGE